MLDYVQMHTIIVEQKSQASLANSPVMLSITDRIAFYFRLSHLDIHIDQISYKMTHIQCKAVNFQYLFEFLSRKKRQNSCFFSRFEKR